MTKSYTTCCRGDLARESYTSTIRFGENAGKTFESLRYICSICRTPSPRMAHIDSRNRRGGGKTECGAACLAGKVSCDCRCNGRCHGADKCHCGEVAA